MPTRSELFFILTLLFLLIALHWIALVKNEAAVALLHEK
jgi:hypothetical protein